MEVGFSGRYPYLRVLINTDPTNHAFAYVLLGPVNGDGCRAIHYHKAEIRLRSGVGGDKKFSLNRESNEIRKNIEH